MSKGTLLFYINSLGKGGAERVISQLAYRFSLEGYRSVLVTSFVSEGEYEIPEGVERISIEKEQIVQSRIKRNISRIKALRKLCIEYKPKALIAFMGEPNFRAVIATMGLPVRTIISVRNDPNIEYQGRLWRLIAKKVLPQADGCVFQTDEAKEWFPKKLQDKSAVIPNEVAEVFFHTDYVGGSDIVTMGRLNPQKNHALLIKAFAQIADYYKDVMLKIYGTGALHEQLQALIDELGMTDRVTLMGSTNKPNEVLARARMFVLSSDYEGMPNALMEALAVGVPCISTDCPCGGPRYLIHDGKEGLLIPVRDENNMVDAMQSLMSDSAYANKIGRNAKLSALKYESQTVFKLWKEFVEHVISLDM